MDIARELAARGEPHGTVIVADFQAAGRGRIRERNWEMERNVSLPFTVLLRYPRIEEIPAALTLRTGLAAALAFEDFVPALRGAVFIKWPNDIMLRSLSESGAGRAKKAAGILTEADGGVVFTGIGINVAQRKFPAALAEKATSIGLAAGVDLNPESRFVLLEKILARLRQELDFVSGGGDAWRRRLDERLYKKNERVRFVCGAANSGGIVEGRLTGIGAGGELLIVPDGEKDARAFITGELQVY
jgi:BirA family biotin operon repressor/biotin-[acetyl-CoA-carboxylase] ligase